MKKIVVVLCLIHLLLVSCSNPADATIITLSTPSLKIALNDQGEFTEFTDVKRSKNYILKDTLAPLLSIRVNQKIIAPKRAKVIDSSIVLDFENDIIATIKIAQRETHFTFELQSVTNKDSVELIVWGPYPTSIQKTISETVGVVRDDNFAIGIQSLNIKTLGGFPWNESDRMPAFDIFKEDDANNMHPKSDGSVLYRIEAAMPIKNGSSLQAYTRNRTKERVYADVGHEKIIAPPYNDGGIIGSKIALFGSDEAATLETIGTIELAEGLPHPMIDGEWVKTNRNAAAAYLITSFTETDIDEALALTKKAGLEYLYHYGKTFESWGHFELHKGEFPNGIAGLKACVEKAAAVGIKLGTHCLSNFINTNDSYVTPVPDKRLAKVGSSVTVADISTKATEILIASPVFFNQMENNNLKTVMLGEELIRYRGVSETAPWRLLDCQRGAFGTKVMSHKAGKPISKLLDHPYNVFLTDASLTKEMSKTLAKLYNQTGLRQISFDGLEGNRSTGLGTYGESLMPYTWYNNLSEDLKNHLIIDASRTTHFFWHIYSRMNWGEPWYAGFRESQVEYRFNNQAYFKRNFMPGMLGWFKMTPETSIEDMEWMLARSAGYDAGYALVADLEVVAKNANSDKILEIISDWEKLRISDSFTEAQKEVMRDNAKEFSIEKVGVNEWTWQELKSEIFEHTKKIKQPGEPLYSKFKFQNLGSDQVLNFSLTAKKCKLSDITLELNNYKKIEIPVSIKNGQTLTCKNGSELILYSTNWQIVDRIKVDFSDVILKNGENIITVDCDFNSTEKEASLKVEIRADVQNKKVVLNR